MLVALGLVTAGGAAATSVRSGLYGVVIRGPIRPVCVAGQPCSAPAPGVVLRFSRGGRVAAEARTRRDGSYRVRLAPGRYSVGGARRLEPRVATVPTGRFRRVDFSIDTGIR